MRFRAFCWGKENAMLTVNVTSTIRRTDARIIGINTNFMTDHEITRSIPSRSLSWR